MPSPSVANTARSVAPARSAEGRARVREASFTDHGGISALQLRNGLKPASLDHWRTQWTANPAYAAVKDSWPIGWVLESAGEQVVGFIANIPLQYHFLGKTILATSPSGWAVDAAYRRDTLRILSRLVGQTGIDLIICTSVGPAAEPIWSLLEVRPPVGVWNRSQFWITSYRGFAESVLRSRSTPLPALLSYPAALGLFLGDRLRGAGLPQRKPLGSLRLETRTDFDSRFDDFWVELLRHKRDTLLADRSRATLQWHFRLALAAGKIWICTVNDGSRLAAYAVFEERDRADFHLRRLRITDFQAVDGFEWTIGPILEWMLAWGRESGFHMLENSGCWLTRPDLPPIHPPRLRRLPAWTYYYKALDSEMGEALRNPSAWAPSAYDGDASL